MAIGKKALSLLSLAFFFVGGVLLVSYLWINWRFNDATLDIIVIHLTMPLTGMDMRYFYSVLLLVALVAIVTAGYGLLLWNGVRNTEVLRLSSRRVLPFAWAAGFALFAGILVQLENKYALREFFFPGEPFSTYIDENYHMPAPEDFTFPQGKNNLIVMILESMEWTFDDKRVVESSLVPRLSAMKATGQAFMGQRQCVGTEYSACGFYSLVLGMPSKANLSVRNMVDLFLGKITQADLEPEEGKGPRSLKEYSLMGLLERNGYRVSLFRAADARFGGYLNTMERSTDRADIRDFVHFLETRPEVTGKQNHWGLFDGYLYDRAREYLEEHGAEPFMMMIQTVDTHPPGYFESGLPRPYGDLRDAYVQADILAADFIEWVQAQPFGANTTIVVVGDHLMGENDMRAVKLPANDRRSIMALVINSTVEATDGNKKRLFATWDLAPTMLEAAGARFPGRRFAMGTSLYSPDPNLLERDGLNTYNKSIKKRSKFGEARYGW